MVTELEVMLVNDPEFIQFGIYLHHKGPEVVYLHLGVQFTISSFPICLGVSSFKWSSFTTMSKKKKM